MRIFLCYRAVSLFLQMGSPEFLALLKERRNGISLNELSDMLVGEKPILFAKVRSTVETCTA